MKRENLHLLLTPSTAPWVCGHPTGHPCAITIYLAFRTNRHMTAGSCSHSAPRAFMKSNTVSCPVHPEGAGWGWGQHAAPASQLLRHQIGKTIFFFPESIVCRTFSCWNSKRSNTNCCHAVHDTIVCYIIKISLQWNYESVWAHRACSLWWYWDIFRLCYIFNLWKYS